MDFRSIGLTWGKWIGSRVDPDLVSASLQSPGKSQQGNATPLTMGQYTSENTATLTG
jgi:hypothetical protein